MRRIRTPLTRHTAESARAVTFVLFLALVVPELAGYDLATSRVVDGTGTYHFNNASGKDTVSGTFAKPLQWRLSHAKSGNGYSISRAPDQLCGSKKSILHVWQGAAW